MAAVRLSTAVIVMANSSRGYLDWRRRACVVNIPRPSYDSWSDTDAFSSPPSGDGVNVALTDSLQLSQQIVKHGLGSLDRAVAEYEKSMFPRAAELITSSAETSKHLFALDAPKGLLEMMEKMMGGADDAADC